MRPAARKSPATMMAAVALTLHMFFAAAINCMASTDVVAPNEAAAVSSGGINLRGRVLAKPAKKHDEYTTGRGVGNEKVKAKVRQLHRSKRHSVKPIYLGPPLREPPDCTTDDECELYPNYCGGCNCDALHIKEEEPICPEGTDIFSCLVDPCEMPPKRTAVCGDGGKCQAIIMPPNCTTDDECKLYRNYCGGCNCEALHIKEEEPTCPKDTDIFDCFADPCETPSKQMAVCDNDGKCQLEDVEPMPPDCTTDDECKLYRNYCGGCNCEALHIKEEEPTCPKDTDIFDCFADPCETPSKQMAVCDNDGKCQLEDVEPMPPDCTTDDECKLYRNYCGGCNCEALHIKEEEPTCPKDTDIFDCFADPCETPSKQMAVCSDDGKCQLEPGSNLRKVQSDLDKAWSKWDRCNLQDYDYNFQRICFCMEEWVQPYNVTVRNGNITSSVGHPIVLTVEKLFDKIQEAINDDAHSIVTQYDKILGFPESISIDYIALAVDDEVVFKIRNFIPEKCSSRGPKLH